MHSQTLNRGIQRLLVILTWLRPSKLTAEVLHMNSLMLGNLSHAVRAVSRTQAETPETTVGEHVHVKVGLRGWCFRENM